ncbi:MAG: helix-turn-helix domain-containing protein [Ignavibacteriales bacterium]|nr:helix-turn-helix domain-containing protein [Ignavibacteriales bacterium]MCF8316827.1 helix-turn-helix domain-containing protein [Ignavibacteriales bacterium]MCF8438403.1 helix-turn-helix domain-containing protein [Ignavibacteriales bacterium]
MKYIVLLFLSFYITGYQNYAFDEINRKIDSLKYYNGSELDKQLGTLFGMLYDISDISIKFEKSKVIYERVKQKGEHFEAGVLINLGKYAPDNKIQYLEEAYKLASKIDEPYLMGMALENQCEIYMEAFQYDKAMTAILWARDNYKRGGFKTNYIVSALKIGDILYRTALYDEANKYYLEIYNSDVDRGLWENWIHRTLLFNFGLIEKGKGNYPKALQWFFKSIELNDLQPNCSTNAETLLYIYVQIIELYISLGDLTNAVKYVEKGNEIIILFDFNSFKPNFYYEKSKTNYMQGKFEEALKQLEIILDLEKKYNYDAVFYYDIYYLFSQIYEKIYLANKSLFYLKKAKEQKDIFADQTAKSRALVIKAEKEYDAIKHNYELSQISLKFLVIISIVGIIFTSFILLFYLKLRKSYLNHVKHYIDNRKYEASNIAKEVDTNNENSQKNQLDSLKLDELYGELEYLIVNEKLFLEKDLTIEKVSKLLNTNRTYLSKAINQKKNDNFNSYINKYRVKEAIDLIHEGKADSMTIEGIASTCGFMSRTVFRTAFKKQVGVTPSFYINNYKSVTENM